MSQKLIVIDPGTFELNDIGIVFDGFGWNMIMSWKHSNQDLLSLVSVGHSFNGDAKALRLAFKRSFFWSLCGVKGMEESLVILIRLLRA